MKALLQRVTQASVDVDGVRVAQIDSGLLVFLGLARGDDQAIADKMLSKLLAYRMFADSAGKMNKSVVEAGGGILLVSQFTLCGDTQKGLRPSFSSALSPELAEPLYLYTLAQLRKRHERVAAGVFGADMQVSLINDGPVTFILEL